MDRETQVKIRKIAVIGNYLPRQCGIATFTSDLVEALSQEYEEVQSVVLAMNDIEEGYDYPERVRFQLDQNNILSYQSAAEFINLNNFDIVSLQHEYGIFGGEAGSHILALLQQLEVPIVTTLHTVLHDPNPEQRRVMEELVRLSDRLVVMSQRGTDYLQSVYRVPADKISVIPHGIHDVPFVDPNFFKDKFDVEGRPVVLTFGLLSPNKGIEYVIQSLPEVKEKFPNIAYLCVGATHPHILRQTGDDYRKNLEQMVKDLDLTDNVIFINRFVRLEELVELIGAADIYITPYLNRDQITSGTLAYTVGAGKAVISTPYWHAEELLAEGRGILIPFRDHQAIAENVVTLLENETERHSMRKRAYMLGRTMIWSRVAEMYMDTYETALSERGLHPRATVMAGGRHAWGTKLPSINLDHLLRLTDNTGIFQHATFHLPNYKEGYTTDDNARALIVSLLLEEIGDDVFNNGEALSARYLSFLWYALNDETGRFRNFLSYDRRWLEEAGSEDSHGRALRALGGVLGRSSNKGLTGVAGRLFDRALPAVYDLTYPRPIAYSLLGIADYLRRFPGDRAVIRAGETLSDGLIALYDANHTAEWPWFEKELTYSNASLPHGLLATSRWRSDPRILEIGLQSLDWLVELQSASNGHFSFIGNKGFYPQNGERAIFDQQPIEAGTMVSACLEAFWLTGDRRWYNHARRAFDWFTGRNDTGLAVYNEETGGCRDGLQADRLNPNQGSESLLEYLSSLLEIILSEQNWSRPVKSQADRKLIRQRT